MTRLAAALTALHVVVLVLLTGGAVLLLLAGRSDRPTVCAWERRVLVGARVLAWLALASGAALVALQTALAVGSPAAAFDARDVSRLLLQTYGGTVWVVRGGLLVLLAGFLALTERAARPVDWLALRGQTALLALLALALLGTSGHPAAVENGRVTAMAVDALHIAATGAWVGGLVPLGLLLAAASRAEGADARPYAVVAARRFSTLALACVLVLVGTGIATTLDQVGDVPHLVGTAYGRLLCAKLALIVSILVLGALNRGRLLPALSGDSETIGRPAMRHLATVVAAETALGLLVIGLAATMSVTAPALHEAPTWPFPFRFAFGARHEATSVGARVLVGSQVAVLGVVALLAAALLRARRVPLLLTGVVVLAAGLALALPPFVVDAYPTTYRPPAVPYAVASIVAGADLYPRHCAACHGASGRGDGPDARALPFPPADLRAPHVAHHLPGDLFWWITRGIAGSPMPGFGDRLDDEARWDLVNYVRALSASEAARRLGSLAGPPDTGVPAPDFTFAIGPTPPRSLHDYRGGRSVLVVLYTLPASRVRLAALADGYELLVAMGAEVVAVPRDAAPDAIRRLGDDPPILFPVVTDGAADIVRAYDLFAAAPHAEFLVDRRGDLRARAAGLAAAPPLRTMLGELLDLGREKAPAAPAEEHVH